MKKILAIVVVLAMVLVVIGLMMDMISTGSGLNYPIWVQLIFILCFLAMTIANLRKRDWLWGAVSISGVAICAVSVGFSIL
ncbi:hypothetical protein [Listeria costaricensis]|uniref:hypothetical protein n=1 Tax=Listeria costaricensis TaxID=2026604 RepID=UPI000C06DC42|nr:hypothetical protein [Listeria costaricensis]